MWYSSTGPTNVAVLHPFQTHRDSDTHQYPPFGNIKAVFFFIEASNDHFF